MEVIYQEQLSDGKKIKFLIEKLIAANKYDECTTFCNRILKMQSNNSTALYTLGWINEMKNNLHDAIQFYLRSINADKNNNKAVQNLYRLYSSSLKHKDLSQLLCEVYDTDELNFNYFSPELNTSEAENFERIYPGYSLFRIFKELKSIFNELVYSPVWSGLPPTLDEWRNSSISSSKFEWLLRNSRNFIPDFYFLLESKLKEHREKIPLKQTFHLLNKGLLDVTKTLNEKFSYVEKKNFKSNLSFERWSESIKGKDEEKLLEKFIQFVKSEMIHSVLLHGSLADGKTEKGFSDFDVTFILNIPENPDEDELFSIAESVIKSNRYLISYNPFMHHGPLINFKDELNWASEATFPSVLIEKGVWLKNEINQINYLPYQLDFILSFAPFDDFFKNHFHQPEDFHNPFDLIWWSSSVMFIPLLLTQMFEGKSIWKRDLFTNKNDHIPVMYWNLLDEVSQLRIKAAKLIQSKVKLPLDIVESDNNPGLLMKDVKEKYCLNINEVQSLGIDSDLLENAKELWEHCKNSAFYFHLQNKDNNTNDFEIFTENWPSEVTEVPVPISRDDYQETREFFLNLCRNNENVISVYEFGNVGSPGLSDLDLLVILDDNFSGVPNELTIDSMPDKYAEVFNHNPIFISESTVQTIGAVFPIFNCDRIYGEELSIKFTTQFTKIVQLSLFTFINVLKYPRDIIYLSKQQKIRWKTFLAYLNSFKHVEKAFSELNIQTPVSIQKCISFNEEIRNNFGQNKISLDDLKIALQLMIEASTDMLLVFEFIWAEVIPELKSIYGLTDKEKYIEEVYECLNTNETVYPNLPRILNVLMLHFQKVDDKIDIPSAVFEKFDSTFFEYFKIKSKFIQNEVNHDRQIDHYILGNTFSTIPQQNIQQNYSLAKVDELKSPQFEWFMFKLNAFAHEHSLREMINWSKIWEYPWIWFHVLMKIDFNGKTVVDLGSEISPIPWLLALKGAKVILIETDKQYLSLWKHLNEKLGLNVRWEFVDDEKIPLLDNSADILTSYSVLEHQPDKVKAVEEVIRVLKPGGVFALSFDICESGMGMTFPEWNGSAINLDEFENILWNNPAFQKTSKPNWNINDITSFWKWHVKTAQHHNYVTACTVFNIFKGQVNQSNIDSKGKIDSEIGNVNALFSTPVLFLIHNREKYTARVFNEIRKIKPSKLYIAADGPKTNDEVDERECNNTRNIVKNIDWKCEVKTLFRTEHLGCKVGVSSAIDWFFDNEVKGIILEDSILPSVTFWKFCEEMLDKYADDSRIMHITGNNLQSGWRRTDDSYYFSFYGSIWGWATWKRAWKRYDIDIKSYPEILQQNILYDIFNNQDEVNYFQKRINVEYKQKNDSWEVQWTFTKLVNSGLSIVPTTNLTTNISFVVDETLVTTEDDIRVNLKAADLSFPIKHPKWILRDKVSDDRYFSFIKKVESGIPKSEILIELNSELSAESNVEIISDRNNITFIRIDSIGDSVLSSFMLPAIKQKFPNSKITVICQDHISELYDSSPYVNQIISIDKNKYSKDISYYTDFNLKLNTFNSDVVLYPVFSREPVGDEIVKNINSEVKIGIIGDTNSIEKEQYEKNNSIYTHLVPIENSFTVELNKNREFLAYLGIKGNSPKPLIWIADEDRTFAENILSSKEFNHNNYIVLFAGAQYVLRSYPYFGKAIAKICEEKNLSVVALGGKEDYDINQDNLNDCEVKTINLSGKTTLRQAAVIIDNAILVVGAETGLAHIACAVETPNVILLGGGHFGRFMPYSNLTSVVALPLDCYKCDWKCKFDHAHCVQDVDHKTIEEAVSQTINNRSDKSRVFIQTEFLPQINANSPSWYFDDELLANNDVEIIEVHPVISSDEIEELIVNKKYEEALNNLFGLLNNEEADLNVLNNIAAIQILTKRWVDASETLRNIIEIDSNNQIALENIQYLEQQLVYHKIILDSEELIKQQKLPEAKKLLQEILEYEPEHIDALNNLAVVEIYEGDFIKAEEVLYKVLELNADDEIAIDNLSYLKELLKESNDTNQVVQDDMNVRRVEKVTEPETEDVNVSLKNETLLSIVLQGRNDGYMGNFEWRLSTNINKLAQNIIKLGIQDKVQIILVDWGSDNPLSDVLVLSDDAKNILDVIYVNKIVADKYNQDSEYSMVHAINTGIRRASGSYIMFSDGDTYIPKETLEKIVELISDNNNSDFVLEQSLLMASRYHIPKSFQHSSPSLDEIDSLISENQYSLDHDKINLIDFTGTATAYLMSREIWYECTGFDESLIYWGWFDIDLFHRIKSKYNTYDFEDFGMPFYHLEHYTDSNNRDMLAENPRKINNGIMPVSFTPNNQDWGLLNEHLSITKSNTKQKKIFNSELNNIIPPEIKDDEFYDEIIKLTKSKDIRTVLEIGSSAGGGSTEAFVKGLKQNPNNPLMFCMEVSSTRFAELKKRYENDKFVKCYNVSSIAIDDFPSKDKVSEFYNSRNTSLNKYPVKQVLSWLDQDIEYIRNSGVDEDGIQIIRKDNNIQNFDLVLIDGSEFTGSVELDKVYGAKYILLDDINAYKNYDSYHRLKKDTNYNLVKENWNTRNGYAIFKFNDNELPVHFFTIVLNGEPFIKYHINLFKQLPFNWHWHIIEGVAELKNDTAWSVPLGGTIAEEFHKNGLSKDGTSEYLNELGNEFPENITVYRKLNGEFWNGKLEMVNAPLNRIKEESLLFEIDSDELWTFEQLLKARELFINNPSKTAAFFWCHFYVGENLVTTRKNAYSKTPGYEWIRAWRFKPGCRWISHEPPALCMQNENGEWIDLTKINPFMHDETEKYSLVFHHYAYVLEEQLKFKEIYYGYKNALLNWNNLQGAKQFPVLLKDYFPWVNDLQQANTLESQQIISIAERDMNGKWKYNYVCSNLKKEVTKVSENIEKQNDVIIQSGKRYKSKIIIDGVIFQLQKNRPHGIYRVWESLLREFAKTNFADRILLLDRESTAPNIPNIKSRFMNGYTYDQYDVDSHYLQEICEEENAALFISTYYTYPDKTHNVLLLHDMIPEVMGWDFKIEQWATKLKALEKANAYFSVSNSTKNDFEKFYPELSNKNVFVVHNAADDVFKKNDLSKVENFKAQYGLKKPYFVISGNRGGYKNAILFFKAFNKLNNKDVLQLLITGGAESIEEEFLLYLQGVDYQIVGLSDEELSLAYSGAVALVYPSKYEGFGLPILEAMQCGCPVITCRNSSIVEIADDAVIYVGDNNTDEMKQALIDVQNDDLRNKFIQKGFNNVNRFSWNKSAEKYREYIVKLLNEFSKMGVNTSTPLQEHRKIYLSLRRDEQFSHTYFKLINLLYDGAKSEAEGFYEIEKGLLTIEQTNIYSLIKSAFENNIKDPFFSYVYGLIEQKNNKHESALKHFMDALNVGWTHWRVGYLAALSAIEVNDIDLAKQLLQMLIKAKPDYTEAADKLKSIENKLIGTSKQNNYKVSAIVSTYNSEKFIRGCLEDLINQTLYKKDELEIVVINSGSQQNEEAIVKEFQEQYKNIIYIKTEERETVYNAWNRGIQSSSGKYIANANTDDRHKENAFEILANELDTNPDTALVYADCKVTETPNEKFDNAVPTGFLLWPEFDRENLFRICYIGPQPMWRKSLHKKYGYFDEKFKSAGDYEFWLRISETEKFKHISKVLGLYLKSDESIEHLNQQLSLKESEEARRRNWKKDGQTPQPAGSYLIHYKRSEQQKADPLFSVIVPTYKRPESLRNALSSLVKQSFENFEVVVVNDANESVFHIVNEFEGRLSFHYVQHPFNRERSAARNNGIRISNGKYIMFLDDDDIYYSNHLEVMSNNINSGYDVIYTDAMRAVYKSENGNEKIVKKYVPYSMEYTRDKLLIGNIAPINCFAIKRETLLKTGLFNEQLRVLEDWELLLRLSSLSDFLHISETTSEVSWRVDGSSTTSSSGNEFAEVRQTIYKAYEKDINKIADVNKIINEFNKIWEQDKLAEMPEVSIIALTHNQLDYTKQFINSVLTNTKSNFELIIIDNASDDNTVSYLEKISATDKRIKTIFNKENLGFPKGVNQGIRESSCDYILIANNDIVVTDGWLERMVEVAESDKTIGIVGPMSNSVSGIQLDKEANYTSIDEMHIYANKTKRKFNGEKFSFPRVAFLCTLIKKSLIEKIGGLDERFSPGNFEDDDFCLRAQLAGYKTFIARDVFIHHFGSKSFTNNGKEKYLQLLERNKKIFVEKWGADPEEIWLKGVKPKSRDIVCSLSESEFTESFQKATKYIIEKDFKSASRNLKDAIANYNEAEDKELIEFSKLLNLAGNIALYNNDFPSAKKYFEDELSYNPDSATACYGLAELLFLDENYQSAKMMYEWAVKNDSTYTLAVSGLQKVNQLLQLPLDDNSLQVSIEDNPLNKADELLKEARINFEDKNFGDALAFATEAERYLENTSLNGQEQELFVSLNNFKGYCYVGLNQLDDAKTCFENALQTEPNSSDTCAGLGEVLYLSGNDDEAKIMFEWAIKNDSENIFADHGLKKVNKNLGLEEAHNSLLIIN